jgi:type I restriction enzyme, S subunit
MNEGWKTETLGDLCEFQRGLTYAKGDEVDGSDNVVLRAMNIDLATNLLTFDELKYINDKVVVPDSKKVKKGSLMICTASGSKSHLGKVAFIDDDYGYAFGGFMGMVTPKSALSSKYLFHLMTSEAYKDFIGELSDGANINNLKFDDLRKFKVPHPPLPEQQRIVGVLDQAFESIAIAQANAETNLENARVIFDSHLQFVFAQSSKDWVEKSVEELVAEGALVKPFDGNHGEIHPKKSDYTGSGVPFIMARDLQNGLVDTENCIFISRKLADSLRVGFAKDGDVLISHKGTIGRSAIVSTQDDYIMLTPQVSAYRVKDASKLFNRFIRYQFMSPSFQREMISGAADGSTRAYIGITKQLSLRLRFPILAEQKRIAAELDILDPETQHLASLYERKLAALKALKKSLLHQAFAGNL